MDYNKYLLSVLLGILCSFAFAMAHSSPENSKNSPIGYWKEIENGKPKAIVQIWKTSDNLLMGKIIKVFSDAQDNTLCTACRGTMHNQPLVGMIILSDLAAKENHWANGHILNFNNGKTYNCAMHITENGKKLKVRGFIGLPILGHSQIWERIDLMSG